MGAFSGPEIVSDSLILCLDAGNTKSYTGSGTTWTDISGNRNNGTLTNGPTYSSSNGGSIVFDGVNDYADVPVGAISGITTNITVSAWIFNKLWKEADVIEGGGTTSTNGGLMIWTGTSQSGANYNGKIIWGKQASTPASQLISTNTYSGLINVWYNIVGTYDGSTSKLYYNGVLDSSLTATFTWNNTRCYIANGLDGYFNGNISAVTIYNRALTNAEIIQNFNALRGRYGI